MRFAALTALTAAFVPAAPGLAQGPGPWQMHDSMSLRWGGMWLGQLFMIIPLALLMVAVVVLVRWMGGSIGNSSGSVRTARNILDQRYARGEIGREERQHGRTLVTIIDPGRRVSRSV